MSVAYLPTFSRQTPLSHLVRSFSNFSLPLVQFPWQILWRNCYRLKNGQRIVLKPIDTDDAPAIVQVFSGLGPESCYLRFGQKQFSHSPKRMHRFAERIVAESSSTGWIAYVVEEGGQERAIGLARYVNLSGDQAEVAFTVVDAYHGLGLGSILWKQLVRSARRAKLSTLVANVHPQNYKMHALIEKSGRPISTDFGVQMMSLSVAI